MECKELTTRSDTVTAWTRLHTPFIGLQCFFFKRACSGIFPVIAATWRCVILTGAVGAQRVYFVTLLLPVRVPQGDSPSPNPVFLRLFSFRLRRTIALLISSDGTINRDRWLLFYCLFFFPVEFSGLSPLSVNHSFAFPLLGIEALLLPSLAFRSIKTIVYCLFYCLSDKEERQEHYIRMSIVAC